MESTHTHDDWFISGFHQKNESEKERERENERQRGEKNVDVFACRACSGERADEAAAGTAQREKLARLAAVTEKKKSACVCQ